MAFESGWRIDAAELVGLPPKLIFKIKRGTTAKRVSSDTLQRYIDSKDLTDWIRIDTRGECVQIEDYYHLMVNVESPKSRIQLFYDDYKLFGYKWKLLRKTFTGFKYQEKMDKCDIRNIIAANSEAIVPDKKDPSYQGDVIAMVMSAALDRDFTHIMELPVAWNVIDAAMAVIEGLGIKPQYWSPILGEEYIHAKMDKSLKQLKEMAQVPGSIKSAVFRQSVKNIVDDLKSNVATIIDQQGMKLHEKHGCVIPSQTHLLRWIKCGLHSLSWNGNTKEIIFDETEIKAASMIQCLKMLESPSHFCINKLGLFEGGNRLVSLLNCEYLNHYSMSKEIFHVWQQIWLLLKDFMLDHEIGNNDIWLMRVKYLMCVHDGDYDEWLKVFEILRKRPNCGGRWRWKYFVRDAIRADIRHKNFEDTANKNECILAGIHTLVDTIGVRNDLDLDNVEFIKDVMHWLYGIYGQDEMLVVPEIMKNVNAITNVSTRFVIVLQILTYYCLDCAKKVPPQLQTLFNKLVPISFDYC